MVKELTAEQVRLKIDPAQFDCKSSAELPPTEGIIGQDRALSALKFGLNIREPGFNVYVSGPSGTGRTTVIKSFLDKLASQKPVPPDWCYVNNFKDSYFPRALSVPAGTGQALQKDVSRIVEAARNSLIQAFASKEYSDRRAEITADINRKRQAVFDRFEAKAREKGFILQSTALGLIFVPAVDGQVMSEEQYNKLGQGERTALKKQQDELTRELKEQIGKLRTEEKSVEQQLAETDRDIARFSVSHIFDELKTKYKGLTQVVDFLGEAEKDIIENFEQFKAELKPPENEAMAAVQGISTKQALRKYEVNVLVDNSSLKGAPVILELNPTFNNLFGRIEKESVFGALYTDFTMIRNGSLHRINGGYLVIRIEDILTNFQSWEGLKRSIRDRKLIIEDLAERLGYVTTKTVRPEPIPLDVKVVLIGEPVYYFLLQQADPEFRELFKVKADFDTRMDRTPARLKEYAGVICRMCRDENLKHLTGGALAEIVEHSSRLAGDQGKLSAMFAEIADIVREANFWANEAGASLVDEKHIEQAIENKVYRSNLIQQHINEMINNGTIVINTEGTAVGQVNGLEVLNLGDFSFGKPSRITTSVGVGREGVIDIEREAKLGGPIHTKGVLILNGYLTSKYAQNVPLSLSARIVFEQSYEQIEGDSASSTELYALISRLADVPIKQSIAVTGSVNQEGEVQAIGGQNEKIEGYFEICRAKGLDGSQGVMIPATNVRHLMLKEDVVAAVKKGVFHIYPVSTIDEGIEVLTGVPAGKRLKNGNFEAGSTNDKVQRRLDALAQKLKEFGKSKEKNQD